MLNKKVLEGIVSRKLLPGAPGEVDSQFECPRCGSSYFGTFDWDSESPTYSCHDEFNRCCSWAGPKEKCFVSTYSKEILAQALLEAYKELERE